MDEPIYLEETGEAEVTFGIVHVDSLFALGGGQATFGVEFFLPHPDEDVQDTGGFLVFSLLGIFTAGNLVFGEPEQFAYSYNGLSGGLMEVDFYNQCCFQFGTDIYITGAIRNIHSPNPVPEPATMLLLGTGLDGLAGIGRGKFFKKS